MDRPINQKLYTFVRAGEAISGTGNLPNGSQRPRNGPNCHIPATERRSRSSRYRLHFYRSVPILVAVSPCRGFRGKIMNLTQRRRGVVRAIAILLALALPTVMAVSAADARVGGGFGSGSRGSRTFSAPPSTSTAPGTAQPFNRTFTQPGSPNMGSPAAAGGGFFNRGGMGRGLLGGLA